MKDFVIYLFLATLGISFQAALFKGVKPDFILILIFYYSLRHGEEKGMAYGALAGFLIDSVNGFILGPNIFSKSIAGFLVGFIRDKVYYWSKGLNATAIILLSLLDIFVVRVCFEIFSDFPVHNAPPEVFAFQIFYTLIFSFILYPFFNRGAGGAGFKFRRAAR
jgi:rod shape-determining protein MreD